MTESTTLEQLQLPPGRWSADPPATEHAGMSCDGEHAIDDLWLGIDSEGRLCVQRPGGAIERRYVAEHAVRRAFPEGEKPRSYAMGAAGIEPATSRV